MTVAFGAFSSSAEFIQPVGSANPFETTHTPSGTPRGIVVGIIQQGTATDVITGITYGGVAMTRVPTNGFAVDTAIEVGAAYCYTLGSGIPTGAQTISVSYTNGAEIKWVGCYSITAERDTEVVASGMVQEDAANPSVTLDSGSRVAFKCGFLFSGRDTVANVTNPAGITRNEASLIAGAVRTRFAFYRTTPASGSETVSQTASSDDVAMVGVAISEVVPQYVRPDADTTTTGWTSTPLWSKIEEETADGTVIQATAA